MEVLLEIYEANISQLPDTKQIKLASIILDRVSQRQNNPEVKTKRHSMIDLLEEWEGQRLFKTSAEADAYLREERDSWDR